MKTTRSAFWIKSTAWQNTFIMDKIKNKRLVESQKYILESGKEICFSGFKELYKVNKNRFNVLQKKVEEGCVECSTSEAKTTKSDKYINAMNWLERYAYYHADRMPDSDKKMLPYRTKKSDVYKQYLQEIGQQEKIKKSSFYDMWKNDFSSLKIKQVGQPNWVYGTIL